MVINDLPIILQEVISRLSVGLDAECIYLFGSRAEDKSRPDSDYDLLVVVPKSGLPRHQREAISYNLLWGITTPVDIIVLTHDEFMRQVQVKTSIASTASTKGVLLYGNSKAT
jgi:uncharacterized protein